MKISPLLYAVTAATSLTLSAPSLRADPTPQYFPADTFDEFVTSWYTKVLDALEEPSLLHSNTDVETVRFTWLPSHSYPVAVRVVFLPDAPAELTLKVADGMAGYDPGKLFRIETRILSDEETSQLKLALRFLEDCIDGPLHGIADGAYYVFERKTQNEFCAIDENWDRRVESDFYSAGAFMHELAGYRWKQ